MSKAWFRGAPEQTTMRNVLVPAMGSDARIDASGLRGLGRSSGSEAAYTRPIRSCQRRSRLLLTESTLFQPCFPAPTHVSISTILSQDLSRLMATCGAVRRKAGLGGTWGRSLDSALEVLSGALLRKSHEKVSPSAGAANAGPRRAVQDARVSTSSDTGTAAPILPKLQGCCRIPPSAPTLRPFRTNFGVSYRLRWRTVVVLALVFLILPTLALFVPTRNRLDSTTGLNHSRSAALNQSRSWRTQADER